MNLGTLPTRHARYRPHHPALVCDDVQLDFATFNARIDRVAHALHDLGLVPGDKIVTLLNNCVELLEIYWAAAKLGLVVVPLSPLLRPQGLAALLDDCDAALVVTETAHTEVCDQLRTAVSSLPDHAYLLVDHDGRRDYLDYAELRDKATDAPLARRALFPDTPYNIIYSSGTTGLPKGIVLSHRTRLSYCTSFAAAFRMTPESVVLHSGALVFNGAFLSLMPAMFLGATYVLQRKFDPAAFIDAVRTHRATHVVMVPTQIVALLDHPDFDPEALSSLEMICSVGAPLLLAHKERLCAALPDRLYELYGLTEGFVTILDRDDVASKMRSVGTPPPLFEICIERPDGHLAEPGEAGEILGRGPILMSEYHNRPEQTAEAVTGGWLRTGDIGYLDEDGYLHLVDRKKDMIISGGVNVYPRDIEELAARHPAVREVAVFGVPDDKWGEVPIAAVRVHDSEIAPQGLREWINQRVDAKFQRVRDVVTMDEFPRNATGKVLKRELRDLFHSSEGSGPRVGKFAHNRGVRVHFMCDGEPGRPDATPLVLLHGLTANAQCFNGLLRSGLSQRFDVIRVDLRGRGLSDKPSSGYTIEEHAGDVLAVMDSLNVKDAVVCGHSYGGLLAMWLAAHHPSRVRRQVLLDIAGPTIVNPEVFRLIQPSLDRLDCVVQSTATYLDQMRALPFLDGFWDDDVARYYLADVVVRQDGSVQPRTSRAVIHQVIEQAQRINWPDIIERAFAPALVIHADGPFGIPGTSPIVLRSQAQELVGSLPDASYVQAPGNHMTMLFNGGARAITTAIERFAADAPACNRPPLRSGGGASPLL